MEAVLGLDVAVLLRYLGLLRLLGLIAGVLLWLFSPIAGAAAYCVIFGLIVAVVGLIAAVLLHHIWPYCGCIWSCGPMSRPH